MEALEASRAARMGRMDDARRSFDEVEKAPGLAVGAVLAMVDTALRLGRVERAIALLEQPLMKAYAPVQARLDPAFHALLDHAAYAPRRLDVTLVWPLEAPMIDRARFRLFREVKIESGLPEGTDVR